MSAKLRCALVLLALSATPASAHSIFLDCANTAGQVECKGSFSDGSSASDFPFEVISYEDELLVAGQSDGNSQFDFPLPEQDYYILLDGGPGHVVEVDMQDVQ